MIREVKNRKNLNAKKRKKTKEENDTLEAYFQEDPSWGRKTVKMIKNLLNNLSVDQIYKWGYDRKLLLKKRQAQHKARPTLIPSVDSPLPDIEFHSVAISDFNQEVADLCSFDTGSSDGPATEAPAAEPRRLRPHTARLARRRESFGGNELLPAAAVVGDFTIVEDDPFFYEPNDEAACSYVVFNESGRSAPHKRPGRRGLFRAPSGFVNMDFYTFREEAFQKEGTVFLRELYKDE